MSVTRIKDEGQKLRYPTGKVLGIVDTRADFDKLVPALQGAGFDRIEALCGDDGVALLERVGTFFFSDMEERVLARHIEELKAGHVIVAVATSGDRVEEAVRIASQNGARRLVHFGPLAVTWHTRECRARRLAARPAVGWPPLYARAFEKARTMMINWNDYHRQVLARIGDVGRLSPETVRGYRALSDAGVKSGKLDAKTRELIALAVAVTRQCDGCIVVHTDAAAKHGATREEIAEALGVAVAVNAGAALVYSARVMDAYAARAEPAAGAAD